MLYLSSPSFPSVQEPPSRYQPGPGKGFVYEIALRPKRIPSALGELPNAHRLVQTLLQGELVGHYELLDFLVWPEGILLRVALRALPSLSEFLGFLKEKSTPSGNVPSDYWLDEPQWLRLVAPEKLPESDRFFFEATGSLRSRWEASGGSSPSLFFFYRNPRLRA